MFFSVKLKFCSLVFCLTSEEIFYPRSSSIKGFLHWRLSFIEGCLSSKVDFHRKSLLQRFTSIEGCFPSKLSLRVVFYQSLHVRFQNWSIIPSIDIDERILFVILIVIIVVIVVIVIIIVIVFIIVTKNSLWPRPGVWQKPKLKNKVESGLDPSPNFLENSTLLLCFCEPFPKVCTRAR